MNYNLTFLAEALRRSAGHLARRAGVRRGYDAGFYQGQREGSRRSARAILPIVNELIRPASVVDVGCGVGGWLAAWRELGVADVTGIDGSYVDRAMLEIAPERFIAHDLDRPLPPGVPGRRFDLAMSLECAEHLRPDSSEAFVRTLTGLAPAVLFSAAIPCQGGTGHTNERWPEEWIAMFEGAGYLAADVIRPRVWHDPAVEPWYSQNAFLFVDRARLDAYAILGAAMKQHPGFPVAGVVHPRLFMMGAMWDGLRRIDWRDPPRPPMPRPAPAENPAPAPTR
jgi:SAM-dependent methyltransferase